MYLGGHNSLGGTDQIRFGEQQVFKMDLCISGSMVCAPSPTQTFRIRMSSLKQTIINAVIKVSASNPANDREGGPTADEARDSFIAMLVDELFPNEVEKPKKEAKTKKAAKAEAPKKAEAKAEAPKKAEAKVEEPKVEEEPKKKGRGPMSEEAKAAMAAKRAATIAAKKAGSVEAVTEQLAQMTVEDEPTPAQVAAGGGKASPKKAAKAAKASPKKAAKAEVNLAKLDPTFRKVLKEADKEKAKEHEPALLAFLNAMTKEAFNGKGAKEHVANFLGGAAPAEDMVDASLEELEFKGKTYYVNPDTKRVYEGVMGEDDTLKVTRPVGYVGMADFKEMTLE